MSNISELAEVPVRDAWITLEKVIEKSCAANKYPDWDLDIKVESILCLAQEVQKLKCQISELTGNKE